MNKIHHHHCYGRAVCEYPRAAPDIDDDDDGGRTMSSQFAKTWLRPEVRPRRDGRGCVHDALTRASFYRIMQRSKGVNESPWV